MGAGLAQAQSWAFKRSDDLADSDRDFIDRSTQLENRAKARVRRARGLVYLLLIGIILGLIGLINQVYIESQFNWFWTMLPYRAANFDPYVLSIEAERQLKPQVSFRECRQDCPEMIVLPPGEFVMGSSVIEKGRADHEGPIHKVTIVQRFAVSKFDVTFADWDACVSVGGCPREGRAGDVGWGRHDRPVIYVSWDDAQAYAAWLSQMTRKTYRLLTEAEWEYAARAGSTTAYFWGDEVGNENANCRGCGSQWDGRRTSPVGSFNPNRFGLYDMAGNVWQWVQDCYRESYKETPTDGSAWINGDCMHRVLRGGSWGNTPDTVRAANRFRSTPDGRDSYLGFRVARTLDLRR